MALSIDKWAGKIAIVTGAASGIGASTSKKLLESGVTVVGIDLQFQNSEISNRENKFYTIKADVSDEAQVVKAFEWILENLGPVHILVNCAGILEKTTLIDGDANLWKKTLDVNVMAVCICTREAVKIMRDRNVNGHIICLNSTSGHVIPQSYKGHNFNVYAASKFAVTALAQTLRQELDAINSKIKITSISPGCTKTPLLEKINRDNHIVSVRPSLKPEDVADAIVYVLSTPEHVQISELTIVPL